MVQCFNAAGNHGTYVHTKLKPNCQQWVEVRLPFLPPNADVDKWRGELDCQSFLNKPTDSSVVAPCPRIQDAEIIPWIPGPGGKRTLDRDATQHDPEKNVILVLLNGDHVPISIHDKSAPACHYQPCNFQDLLFI